MSLLSEKVVVVTGASSGIGKAVAECFAGHGASVVLAARRRERLDAIQQQIRGTGGKALAVTCDVTDELQVIRLFAEAKDHFGPADILINNAGVTVPGPIESLTLEQWQNVLSVNLTGVFLCAREAMKQMIPRTSGRIVNIGSISAQMPRIFSVPYTTTKHAIVGMTKALALEGRKNGITVCCVHPGNVDTEIWSNFREVAEREGIIDPVEIARLILHICTLPDDVNMLETIILPLKQPYLGRG